MSDLLQLVFERSEEIRDYLPQTCSLRICEDVPVTAEPLIAAVLEGFFRSLAETGIDLRALDGITVTDDCITASKALLSLPVGQVPLETDNQPDTVEMARTVPVWRDGELRFHIVLRTGLSLAILGSDASVQALAYACIAHEAAHVEHEEHLYRAFPYAYGTSVPCGNRSQQTFLKAVDVWSEYAACRSSAMFRPEGIEEFERIFCRALEDSFIRCQQRIAAYRECADALGVFVDLQQIFGDVFISAGCFLGHLDGLELNLQQHAPRASSLLEQYPEVKDLILRLRRILHELWLTEYSWASMEVFAPIYDLLCAMMAINGFVFARTTTEWRMVMCEDGGSEQAALDALARWLRR